MQRFLYQLIPDWPPLAWLAVCRRASDEVRVLHGLSVETADDWFCEAVWDGPFGNGDFDATANVFGSGCRRRAGSVCFVTSTATVDRLHVVEDESRILVSNSLPCLLSQTAHQPTRPVNGYAEFFRSIGLGIERYDSKLPSQNGHVRLVYFRNLIWDGRELRDQPKPEDTASLDSYRDYKSYLIDCLVRIGDNLRSPERVTVYSWLGTLSRGFDSPASVALAREAGLAHAITFMESRPGVPDDGRALGEALGVHSEMYDRLGWHGHGLWEPLFVSADGQGKEISVASAGSRVERTVLLTGNGGDYVWNVSPRTPPANLHRGAHSGLSLCEYRLHRGFLNLALPFIAMIRARNVVRISQSTEMSPWRSGTAYDRPICTRILQEAGVSRDLFGQSKTGNSVRFVRGEDSWSRVAGKDFHSWLARRRRSLDISGTDLLAIRALRLSLRIVPTSSPFGGTTSLAGVNRIRRRLARRIRHLGGEDLVFEWAVDRIRTHYGRHL